MDAFFFIAYYCMHIYGDFYNLYKKSNIVMPSGNSLWDTLKNIVYQIFEQCLSQRSWKVKLTIFKIQLSISARC